jgi:DNA-directed RNA polymerase subunit RPC12/RpoP
MKYRCSICDRDIDDFVSIAHIKAEEYLLALIRRDHPEWKDEDIACHKCIEYYRKLIKESEI